MSLVWLIIFLVSFIIAYIVVIIETRRGKYLLIKDNSILSKKLEEKYLKEFPNYTIDDLKIEIAKIADMLVANQESNRYTELLRLKANKDGKIQILKDAVVDNVDLIKYDEGNLKARIRYKDYKFQYLLIFDMNTVARGRVFLNKYFIFKSVI